MLSRSVAVLNCDIGSVLTGQLSADFCTKHGNRSNIAIFQYWEAFSFQNDLKAANAKTINALNTSTL